MFDDADDDEGESQIERDEIENEGSEQVGSITAKRSFVIYYINYTVNCSSVFVRVIYKIYIKSKKIKREY